MRALIYRTYASHVHGVPASGERHGRRRHVGDRVGRSSTDIVVLAIPRAKFLALLENEPKVTLAVLMTRAQRPRDAQV
jgi:hypothetical protein